MTPQSKTTTLLITTLIVYASTGWLQNRQLIFPFPLNEIIFLFVTGYFYFLSKDRRSLLLLIGTCFFVGSNEFYWNIFLSSEQMVQFSKLLISDICYLVFYSCLIITSIINLKLTSSNIKTIIIHYSILTVLLFGLFLNSNEVISFSFLLFSVFCFKINSNTNGTLNFTHSVYILTFLLTSKTITLLLA